MLPESHIMQLWPFFTDYPALNDKQRV